MAEWYITVLQKPNGRAAGRLGLAVETAFH
ncbi:hypothetical protein Terro_3899 [Terriglobus roseus DSM 18391]|uniref:Uncharacterized protein n=1 Tax=Terriglobus roseus (strain DSM 18391 / NRRL B-41598 / KBS 63) TaxID=926566 RepID=I3ZLJ0_TERRK|nr:hypothetical protein Terro_3899 [Terriglobus roseus DSM 18391]